jgi:metallo-beta-lactamase family protein
MNNNNNTDVKIQFLGAAGTVTGSKYFIQAAGKNVLVDCGLFQGLRELSQLNWQPLAIDAASVDIVLLTHGHLDHTGYLPRLVKEGFKGQVWGTAPTLQIAKVILEDSARIQEEDADRANKQGFSKHNPVLPLYGIEDVENTLPLFYPQPLDTWVPLAPGMECRYKYNGHIIGATFIELKVGEKVIVFSGDIGRENDLLMYPPQQPTHADVVVMEATYGGTTHPENAEAELIRIINDCAARQGSIIIPSFAVERTQLLMYLLWKLKASGDIPAIPVYMDSPMAANVLDVFERNLSWHKLPLDDCRKMCEDIKIIDNIRETNQLAQSDLPKIVIAGSGMATGGRVLTYMLNYLPNPTATILLAGFQSEGTRGRDLLDGATEIKIFGKFFSVKAKIENITSLSSHAGQPGLINWLSKLDAPPKGIFLVHGETDALEALQAKLKEVYGWDATIAVRDAIVTV